MTPRPFAVTADPHPPVVEADPADPRAWLAGAATGIRNSVRDHGAVLVRGAGIAGADDLAELLPLVGRVPAVEREAFAPRTPLAPSVYSTTPWPAGQQMCAHHELSYVREFPGLLAFACVHPGDSGGTTGIVDATAVLADLPAELVARAERDGWLLCRSYGEGLGASWEQVFGTTDPAAVEAYCRAHDVETEWTTNGLRTRQRRAAVARHATTGRRVWFNQIAFLSEWTMDPDVREFLLDTAGLPFSTRFGDGGEIGEETVAEIAEVYLRHTATVSWQAGDLLLLDNVRCAHSREPYTGPREMVVGFADPTRLGGLP